MQPGQRELETLQSLLRAAPAHEFELVHPSSHAGVTGLFASLCHYLFSSDRANIITLHRAVLPVLLALGTEGTLKHLIDSLLVVYLVLFNLPVALGLQLQSVTIADACGRTVG